VAVSEAAVVCGYHKECFVEDTLLFIDIKDALDITVSRFDLLQMLLGAVAVTVSCAVNVIKLNEQEGRDLCLQVCADLICQICIDIIVVSLGLFDESWDAILTFIPILGAIKSAIYCMAILLYGLFVLDESLPFPTFVAIWMMTAIVSTIILWTINAISHLFFDFNGWLEDGDAY
jgi:hypothetical protein